MLLNILCQDLTFLQEFGLKGIILALNDVNSEGLALRGGMLST